MKFFHASRIENYNSIIKNGLKIGYKSSGYGKKPEHKAIYLYHINNVDVACDFIKLFGKVDIFQVEITENLFPDEDSNVYFWKDSVNKIGTCACKQDIFDIKFIGRFYTEKDYINWVKDEIYF